MITELKGNFFSAPQGYYLCHCITADLSMGAGIAKQMDKLFNLKTRLAKQEPTPVVGECLAIDNVFNLVTKENSHDTVDIEVLEDAIAHMREYCDEHGIRNIAMPRLGCGMDHMDWDEVYGILSDWFEDDSDYNIVVYHI